MKVSGIWILTTSKVEFVVGIRLVTSFERISVRKSVNWRGCWNIAFFGSGKSSFVSDMSIPLGLLSARTTSRMFDTLFRILLEGQRIGVGVISCLEYWCEMERRFN